LPTISSTGLSSALAIALTVQRMSSVASMIGGVMLTGLSSLFSR
jgi:hypothetical protein